MFPWRATTSLSSEAGPAARQRRDGIRDDRHDRAHRDDPHDAALLAFQKIEKKLELFDLVVDCIFLADAVRNLNTGIVTDADQIIFDRRTITKRYITSWFVPDL